MEVNHDLEPMGRIRYINSLAIFLIFLRGKKMYFMSQSFLNFEKTEE